MDALNLHGVGDLRFEDVPFPDMAEDEVLLKVLAAGICGSDVPRVFSKGTYHFPTIVGHEFVGEVVKAGDGADRSLVGKRVAVFPLLPCFACVACKDENYAACVDYDYYGSRRNGAFADYIAVKPWNLIPVPDGVPNDWAAMTEPAAVAVHAVGAASIRKGSDVCVFGAGPIGLMIALLAYGTGAKKVVLLDVDEKKLEFARGLGFEHTLNTRDKKHMEKILKLTNGKGADVCFEVAGVSETIAGSLKAAASFGQVVLVGNPSGDIFLKQIEYWQILRKQLKLSGTWNSDFGSRKNDWKTALYYMENGILDLTGFVTHIFPLSDAKAAFELLRDPKEFCIKVMFLPNDSQSGIGYDDDDDDNDDIDYKKVKDRDV